jgi:hypothetical protein
VAKHGNDYQRTFGRSDYLYSYQVIRPHIYVTHSDLWHISKTQRASHGAFSKDYTAYRSKRLGLLMTIRNDSLARYLPALDELELAKVEIPER